MANLSGQFRAKAFNDGHLLERQGALKILATVQTTAQNKVAAQQGSGLFKKVKRFAACHEQIKTWIALMWQ
jgi:hypothetical protein